jgi:hypothetical protein
VAGHHKQDLHFSFHYMIFNLTKFTLHFIQFTASAILLSECYVHCRYKFSWHVPRPRRSIKAITALEKLHVVRSTKNYQISLSNYSSRIHVHPSFYFKHSSLPRSCRTWYHDTSVITLAQRLSATSAAPHSFVNIRWMMTSFGLSDPAGIAEVDRFRSDLKFA